VGGGWHLVSHGVITTSVPDPTLPGCFPKKWNLYHCETHVAKQAVRAEILSSNANAIEEVTMHAREFVMKYDIDNRGLEDYSDLEVACQ